MSNDNCKSEWRGRSWIDLWVFGQFPSSFLDLSYFHSISNWLFQISISASLNYEIHAPLREEWRFPIWIFVRSFGFANYWDWVTLSVIKCGECFFHN